MDERALGSLLDLAYVEVDDDAECIAVLPLSKSSPPQPKLVSPQVQLVKAESPARSPLGSGCSRVGAVIIVRARREGGWVHSTRGSHNITLRSFFLLIFKDEGAELILSRNFNDRIIARCSLVESDFTSLSDDVSISTRYALE